MSVNPVTETLIRALLAGLPGVGPASQRKILRYFGSAEAAWCAELHQWLAGGGSKQAWQHRNSLQLEQEMSTLNQELSDHRTGLVSLGEPGYPQQLEQSSTAPTILYYQGNLQLFQDSLGIAVVGTRRATSTGRDIAFRFGSDLARTGVLVISGLAAGIDGSAHRGALAAGRGQTVAVLGGGFSKIYPKGHLSLAQEILTQGGLLLSEYRPSTPPLAGQFVARNRIISGLSHGVVVIEAPRRSGALITAGFAADEGRDVFAVPGGVNDLNFAGCLDLIKEGAKLVTEPTEVISEYSHLDLRLADPDPLNLSAAERRIVLALLDRVGTLDQLTEYTGLPWGETAYIVTNMQVQKVLGVDPGGNLRPGPSWGRAIAGLQKEGSFL